MKKAIRILLVLALTLSVRGVSLSVSAIETDRTDQEHEQAEHSQDPTEELKPEGESSAGHENGGPPAATEDPFEESVDTPPPTETKEDVPNKDTEIDK